MIINKKEKRKKTYIYIYIYIYIYGERYIKRNDDHKRLG